RAGEAPETEPQEPHGFTETEGPPTAPGAGPEHGSEGPQEREPPRLMDSAERRTEEDNPASGPVESTPSDEDIFFPRAESDRTEAAPPRQPVMETSTDTEREPEPEPVDSYDDEPFET